MTGDLLNIFFLFLFLPIAIIRRHQSPQKDNSNIQSPYDSFSSTYSNGFGGVFQRPNTDWIDLVMQPYPFSSHYTQGMSYIIRNLEPDQQYEAKVIARYVKSISRLSFQFNFLLNRMIPCCMNVLLKEW